MTDRLAGVVVIFERDIREDDAEATIAALKQIKGVLSIAPIVADLEVRIAEERARHALADDLWKVLDPDA